MSLLPGTRLGPYDILAPLGAGGFGEVYKARDTRLDRTVAIKVLPSADPDLKARFEREAKAIASLQHPHICTLHDVGHQDGTDYLVLEYLEGETLAARLEGAKGPLALAEALKIATQIADALDRAHRAGITHRDLKPANIMLTKTGGKLLDFGLAKLRGPAAPISMSVMERATVASGPATATGTILGTVHYMAPEQVEGREADARSDIWALGAVMYEMVTGTRPFEGASAASVIGAILKDTPAPISTRQPLTPPLLDHVVARCLDKDPDERWQTASDLKRELTWAYAAPSPAAVVTASPRRRIGGVVLGIAALLALAATVPAAWRHWQEPSRNPSLTRFTISPPTDAVFSAFGASVPGAQFALSPDGRAIVYVANQPGGRSALWLRVLDALEPRVIPGTEDASYPFWAPDNQSIGFFAEGKLKRVDLAGGPPRALASTSVDARGGTWSRDGTIVFALAAATGLSQVDASGGRAVVAVPPQESFTSYRWPTFLPDGRHFLFYARSTPDKRGIYVAALGSPSMTRVLDTTGSVLYSPPGYLLTVRDATLLAYPFDAAALRVTGEPISVAETVGGTSTQRGNFSVSNAGVLAHSRGLPTLGQLTWFARDGRVEGTVLDVGDFPSIRLSPDEARLAVSIVDVATYTPDIWLVDLTRGVRTRFTFDPGSDVFPVWSPDGSQVVFRSDRSGGNNLFEKPTNGVTAEKLLTTLDVTYPTDWSRDGRFIAFHTSLSSSSYDVALLPRVADPKPIPAASAFSEIGARFSPDGRLIAYASDESGRPEVYVQQMPGTGARWQVTANGGAEPQWRGDGRELFYLAPDRRMMAATIASLSPFTVASTRALFQTHISTATSWSNPNRTNYEATRDGQRFLVNEGTASAPGSITVVLNWTAAMKK